MGGTLCLVHLHATTFCHPILAVYFHPSLWVPLGERSLPALPGLLCPLWHLFVKISVGLCLMKTNRLLLPLCSLTKLIDRIGCTCTLHFLSFLPPAPFPPLYLPTLKTKRLDFSQAAGRRISYLLFPHWRAWDILVPFPLWMFWVPSCPTYATLALVPACHLPVPFWAFTHTHTLALSLWFFLTVRFLQLLACTCFDCPMRRQGASPSYYLYPSPPPPPHLSSMFCSSMLCLCVHYNKQITIMIWRQTATCMKKYVVGLVWEEEMRTSCMGYVFRPGMSQHGSLGSLCFSIVLQNIDKTS